MAALKQSSETDGVPAAFLESPTWMVRQMWAAQEDMMRNMGAEHDAKMDKLLRAMDRLAKKGNTGYDPPDEFRKDGVYMGHARQERPTVCDL